MELFDGENVANGQGRMGKGSFRTDHAKGLQGDGEGPA